MTTANPSTAASPAASPARLPRPLSRLMGLAAVLPMRRLSPLHPRQVGLEVRDLTLPGEAGPLAAWFVPHPDARAGVVLCHGYSDSRAQFLPLMRPLHEAGFHVLSFDFRAHGRSGGRICTYGAREQYDVATALDWLRSETGLQTHGLMGCSMGGVSSILAAATDDDVAAVASDCAFARLEDMPEQRLRFLPPSMRVPAGIHLARAAQEWTGIPASEVNPEATLRSWKSRPLMLIHGEKDRLTPPEHAHRLARAAREQVDLWIVPGAPHAQSRAHAGAVYPRRVCEFFRKHLPTAR